MAGTLLQSKGLKSFGRYGSVGFELLASIAVGYYLGRWIDGKLGTHWIAFVGFLLGCYAGFRALFRTAKQMQRDIEREEKLERGEDPWADEAPNEEEPLADSESVTALKDEITGKAPNAHETEAMTAPKPEEPNDDAGRAAKAAAIIGAILSVAAFGLYGARPAFSVLVGAVIAVANLVTMRAIIRALLPPPEPDASNDDKKSEEAEPSRDHKEAGRRGGAAWGIFAAFKILILFGGVWLLLTRKLVDPMPLVVGYGVLPLGIAASALWSSLVDRR